MTVRALNVSGVYGVAHPAARYTVAHRDEALRLYRAGASKSSIAQALGCQRETVARWLYEAMPEAFAMPLSMRRTRRGPEFAAARAAAEERLRVRRELRAKAAARRAELVAQGEL
jgi:transposase